MKEGSAIWQWRRDLLAATEKIGIDSLKTLEHPRMLKEQGFQNIGKKVLKIPMGPWAKGKKEKQIGIMAQKDLVEGIEGVSQKLFLMMGYEPENLKEFFEKVKKELMDPAVSTKNFELGDILAYYMNRCIRTCVCKYQSRSLAGWMLLIYTGSSHGDRNRLEALISTHLRTPVGYRILRAIEHVVLPCMNLIPAMRKSSILPLFQHAYSTVFDS